METILNLNNQEFGPAHELINDLLLHADTLELREVLTDLYVNSVNSEGITKDQLDKLSNIYLGLMYFLNSIDRLKNQKNIILN